MNKLTALYNLMKHMKETKAFSGAAELEAKLDETVVGTVNATINCAPERCEKKMELRFGEEVLKFEHQGTEKFCHPMCGPGGHHHHGHGCVGPHGKLERIMFLLKVLDKTELQELEDGTKVLAMELAPNDLPNCVNEHMNNKCCGIDKVECLCGHHDKLHGWMASCGCMDLDFSTMVPERVSVKLKLNSDCSPAGMSAVITGTAADKDGKSHTITINAGCKHQ